MSELYKQFGLYYLYACVIDRYIFMAVLKELGEI